MSIRKQWNPVFSTERNFNEDKSYVQSLWAVRVEENEMGDVRDNGDNLDIFMEEFEGKVPYPRSREVKAFCQGVCLRSLQAKAAEGRSGSAKAWLNDKEYSTQRSRSYRHRLTAYQLYTSLIQQRFGLTDLPDVDRRLIYVQGLDPEFICALTETASFHQVLTSAYTYYDMLYVGRPLGVAEPLRDAIWKHIALQTSIRVKLSPIGYPIFCLEFHLPYSALREVATTSENLEGTGTNNRPQRDWIDLSFLDDTTTTKPTTSVVHDAHVSLVICGSDHSRWVCYAFVNTEIHHVFSMNGSGNDAGEEEDQDEEDEFMEDPIPSDCESYEAIADALIWDPRLYFLRNVDFRMRQIDREWTCLVRKVEIRMNQYRKKRRVTLSRRTAHDEIEELTDAFDWVSQTIELLQYLRERLSQTIRAWERFDGTGGDIEYFSDLSGTYATVHIGRIRESFEELKDLDSKLMHLDVSFHQKSRKLELSLSLQSSRQTLESHRLNRNSHDLNLKTIEVTREGYEVSVAMNRVAIENQNVAIANHETARLSLSIDQIWQPVGLAVALFSAQQEILRFDKTPKSFAICVVILIVLAQICAIAIVKAHRGAWAQRFYAWVESILPKKKRGHDIELNSFPVVDPRVSRHNTI